MTIRRLQPRTRRGKSRGATIVEFALVAPVFFGALFGSLDGGVQQAQPVLQRHQREPPRRCRQRPGHRHRQRRRVLRPGGRAGHLRRGAAGGAASLQTQDPNQSSANIYNGLWVRYDIAVPSNYDTADITASDPTTWFWNLSYTTALAAGDTITANLGFTGAPVHIVSG